MDTNTTPQSNVWYGTKDAFVAATRRIVSLSDRACGGYALGHYFLWAKVQVGKKVVSLCCTSGCSMNPQRAVEAVQQIPGVIRAWYNLD